ncbi:DNRLRE domain-containing protein [Opitutaceae bacterium TAV4]|nr:DNRLRE domain-containing protein [Opitutaceae bacterium TAV4]RRJ98716.1 DNRLRE domain-containing protein [Opitutaceae bacterium TAV3]
MNMTAFQTPPAFALSLLFTLAALSPILAAAADNNDNSNDGAMVTGSDFQTLIFRNGDNAYAGATEAALVKDETLTLSPDAPNLPIEHSTTPRTGKPLTDKQTLLRFDDIFGGQPAQIPTNAPIVSATLRLHTAKGARTRVFFNRLLQPWTDAARDGNGIQANEREARAEPDTIAYFLRDNAAVDVNLTKSLRAWTSGKNANHGWVLRHTGAKADPLSLVSSLSADPEKRPRLSVTFDARPGNPPPTASELAATRNASASPAAPAAVTLSLRANHPAQRELTVTFHARKQAAAAPDFEIIVLPDTQYYTRGGFKGSTPEIFDTQTAWIVKNRRARNIAAVLHLGDITDRGDVAESEWQNADHSIRLLEDPVTTGLPDGIPYSLALGDHDSIHTRPDGKQTGGGPALFYNRYFGSDRFAKRAWYAGHFGDKNNNNHCILFESGGERLIAISLESQVGGRTPAALKWADALLKKHADRRAIVTSHNIMWPGPDGNHSPYPDGKAIYEALKTNKNLMLLIGGHHTGVGHRADVFNGSTVHSLVRDFQSDDRGGTGFLTILRFSPRNNQIHVSNYSPLIDRHDDYNDGEQTLDYDFRANPGAFKKIATTQIHSGETATCRLETGADSAATWEWFAKISDPTGGKILRTPTREIPPATIAKRCPPPPACHQNENHPRTSRPCRLHPH